MNATVTTIIMATVILTASSNCFINMLTAAEPIHTYTQTQKLIQNCKPKSFKTYQVVIKLKDFEIVEHISSMLDHLL